jgi:phage tail sheath gpL-like
MASDAVGADVISRVVGYNLKKGNFQTSSPNLPQRIAILAEANLANQSTLDLFPKEITSAKQAGELYGYGSPIHMIMRILRPFSGEGVGSIPTIVYPQAQAGGAAAKVLELIVTGTPNKGGVHYLRIAGRTGIDGNIYQISITTDDTAATIHAKIATAVNAVLACPMTAQNIGGYEVDFTSKWRGSSAEELSISVDTGGDSFGLTYTINNVITGVGVPSISSSLNLFGNEWNTWLLNSYGLNTSIMTTLEQFNGIPKDLNPTGRYQGTQWKPFIAVSGSVADNPSTITDLRKQDVTIAVAPAPLSKGLSFEAAANAIYLAALTARDNPHLDVAGQFYPDMPVPVDANIGSMASFVNRDAFVKKGCSTVDYSAGKYQMQDFVTTYHPDGETPWQFSYCRNLVVDMNVRYGYLLREQVSVVDHVIANDDDIVAATKVVKPKTWKSELFTYADDLEARALIVDSDFMQASLVVNIGTSNPNRLETFFRYKRSGVAKVLSTTAEAGFNFGTLTA